jgi:hypothetical protein
MKIISSVMFAFILAMSAHAQTTWIGASGVASSITNTLTAAQVLDIITMAVDDTVQIQVIANNQTVSFGSTGNPNTPAPFVVAGPATVIFRKTSTAGSGTMITYRISDKVAGAKGLASTTAAPIR